MVGLVLVSHSATMARGLVELIDQLAPDVTIVTAAGTEDGRIGTSPDAVAAALTAADSGDGVVVIPDLGSAVLAVRVALEDVDESRFVLVDAPFVEGAVSAAVTAGTGATLDEVVAAAHEAREIPKF
ncbi:MAG TPA: dihydroxyacetone kinase phosphoryl donor subunit DhaM [Mycobacteriales bacterium]|nr:dihydroxyacetone kinase phosphoryl donor subunit DhaM [Mycobacteriales bacterium]